MPRDPEITDQDLGSEIELLADVITAASGAEQTLSQEQIDSALGVCPQEPREAPALDSDAGAPPGPAADDGH
jgi:hypothetical protein